MFEQAMARIAGRFRRVEPRATARAYLLGPLSGVERKNCWQLAEQAGHSRPGPMQRLLRTARWDADAVRDEVRAYVVEHLGTKGGVLINDPRRFALGVRTHVLASFLLMSTPAQRSCSRSMPRSPSTAEQYAVPGGPG